MSEQDHTERIEQAAQFVRRHGTTLDRTRLDSWLAYQPIGDDIITTFLAGQQEDGGWPAFWSSGAASVDATGYRLVQAEQMRLFEQELAYPGLLHAIVFLRQQQHTDGHWEEAATLHEIAPPWVQPGDAAATLYLTANCGCCLAMLERRYGISGGLAAGQGASSYLLAARQSDGTLPSFLQTHWLAACLWHLVGEHFAAAWIFEIVWQRLLGKISPGQLVWFINSFHAAGILADDQATVFGPIFFTARERFIAAQRADGSWSSDDGPQFDVMITLEAIYALTMAIRAVRDDKNATDG